MGQKHGGGPPEHFGGGGGQSGQTHCAFTQTGFPHAQAMGPKQPPPDEDPPLELELLEDVPDEPPEEELLEPELVLGPVSGATEPPQAARTTTKEATEARTENMTQQKACSVPTRNPGKRGGSCPLAVPPDTRP